MELALAACLLGWVITTWRLIDALKEKDRHHSTQISGLLTRIQAPAEAVARDLTQDEDFETMILPHTEESYWADLQHKDVG